MTGSESRERPAYEFINAKWLRSHTFSEAGNALLRDLERMAVTYDWLKTDEERRSLVLRDLVELGSILLVTASRELRQDVGLRQRPKGKAATEITVVPPPSRRLEEVPA